MLAYLYSIRSKLILSIIGIALLVGGSSLVIARMVLYDSILEEAKARVGSHLMEIEEILHKDLREIKLALLLLSKDAALQKALKEKDLKRAKSIVSQLHRVLRADFAGVAAKDLKASVSRHVEPFYLECERIRAPISGISVLDADFLITEDPSLYEKARIIIEGEGDKGEINSALSLVSAVPVFDGSSLVGVIYSGVILNRNFELVDRIRDTIFQVKGASAPSPGTVTVFLEDVRVSTNVETSSGERAIGTKVSEEVRKHVLEEGKMWLGRAFVVKDWYISAYKPIKDIRGKIVGMVYVGIPERRYTEIWKRANVVLIPVTLGALLLAVLLGYYLTDGILRPVRRLIDSAREVQRGNFSVKIGEKSRDEIGILQGVFEEMVESLKQREKIKDMEKEILYLKSEKQASIGKLAAGVAHEINNPLTGVLTYTHLLLQREDIPQDAKEDLKVVLEATERVRKIVKGLLSFSREMPLEKEPTDINELIRSTLALTENQALIKGVNLVFEPKAQIPPILLDRNQMQSVILNLVVNALDATSKGGTIKVTTDILAQTDSKGDLQKYVQISVADTGCGIAPENLERIFDPFFTTKEVGQGTGLGLAVAKGVVERHGGTISVKSELGKGSVFTIELPVPRPNE